MSLRRLFVPSIGLVLLLLGLVAAQDSASPQAPKPERGVNTDQLNGNRQRFRRMKERRRFGPERRNALAQLNITEEQRQQRRAIMQRHLAGIKSQRDELFQLRTKRMEGSFTAADQERAKAIRQELRSTMQNIHGEMLNTLTTDQKSQLDALREQRKQRREEFMKRREERMKTRPPQ